MRVCECVCGKVLAHHKGGGRDVGEEMDGHPPAGEDGRSQPGKAFAAATADRVGTGIVAYDHTTVQQVLKVLLQVTPEPL